MSQVTVLLRGAYRDFAGRSRMSVDAATVGEALERAIEACPALRERVRDEHGRLREHLNVFANDEDIRRLDGERTALNEGDIVHLIPAISGG
ncbi:MAG: hypothetical protein AUH85_04045 [Chloroflexi bacterium 13_1_40CM_4_68_4]|nr:MAG: hypothetical protein AUH85_04045 [Chloroflexi bacterium 13_1_40CM_4_68_4]